MTDLPPVSIEQFASKLQSQQATPQSEWNCNFCSKSYNSQNAYTNHIHSSKHLKTAAKKIAKKNSTASASQDTESKPSIPWRVQMATAETPEMLNEIIDKKMAASKTLTLQDCLFCTHTAQDLKSNIEHMSAVHSFYIPDQEFLVDLEGLITYLGEKISVGNICIFCNGKGRSLFSLEAVRKHMIDKGHCKIAYENGDEMDVSDFYDFSSTWEGIPDTSSQDSWEDINPLAISVTSDLSLALPNGKLIRHKSHRVVRVPRVHDSVIINRIHSERHYEKIGAMTNTLPHVVRRNEEDKRIQNKNVMRQYSDFRMKVGVHSNKSTMNKHFRSQIGFD